MTEETLGKLYANFDNTWKALTDIEKAECVEFLINVLDEESDDFQKILDQLEFWALELTEFIDEEVSNMCDHLVNKTDKLLQKETNKLKKMGDWTKIKRKEMLISAINTYLEDANHTSALDLISVAKNISKGGFTVTNKVLASVLVKLESMIEIYSTMVDVYIDQRNAIVLAFPDEVEILNSEVE